MTCCCGTSGAIAGGKISSRFYEPLDPCWVSSGYENDGQNKSFYAPRDGFYAVSLAARGQDVNHAARNNGSTALAFAIWHLRRGQNVNVVMGKDAIITAGNYRLDANGAVDQGLASGYIVRFIGEDYFLENAETIAPTTYWNSVNYAGHGVTYPWTIRRFSDGTSVDEVTGGKALVPPPSAGDWLDYKPNTGVGLWFIGDVEFPEDGDYTFYNHSDDFARSYIDGKLIFWDLIGNSDTQRQTSTAWRTMFVTAGTHQIMIGNQNRGGRVMTTFGVKNSRGEIVANVANIDFKYLESSIDCQNNPITPAFDNSSLGGGPIAPPVNPEITREWRVVHVGEISGTDEKGRPSGSLILYGGARATLTLRAWDNGAETNIQKVATVNYTGDWTYPQDDPVTRFNIPQVGEVFNE